MCVYYFTIHYAEHSKLSFSWHFHFTKSYFSFSKSFVFENCLVNLISYFFKDLTISLIPFLLPSLRSSVLILWFYRCRSCWKLLRYLLLDCHCWYLIRLKSWCLSVGCVSVCVVAVALTFLVSIFLVSITWPSTVLS